MEIPRNEIRKLLSVLNEVRDTQGDMSIQMLSTLLTIALNDGESQQTIQKLTSQTGASTSRNIQAWTRWTQRREARGTPPFVELQEDPAYRRRNLTRLTPAGGKFLSKLLTGGKR